MNIKKHILILNAGYIPAKTYGGPVVSIHNLIKLLNEKYDFTVVTSSTEVDGHTQIKDIKENDINILNTGERVIYLDKKHYNKNFVYKLLGNNPAVDIIYINSFFNFKQLLMAFKLHSAYKDSIILIAPRGELEKNAFNIKKTKKNIYTFILKHFIKRDNIYFQSTSESETFNIKSKLKVLDDKILELNNIPTILDNSIEENTNIKKKNNLKMVFISRIQSKKNLHYALEVLKRINKNITLSYDIYGPIESKEYWDKCLEIIKDLPKNITVNYKGIIAHDEVFDMFRKYHVFFFPTLSENFGHVICEALTSGCPVLISDQTPWNDINKADAGRALNLNKPLNFVNYIEYLAKLNNTQYKEIVNNVDNFIKRKIDIREYYDQYLTAFNKILKESSGYID